jgi:hypothetical protein
MVNEERVKLMTRMAAYEQSGYQKDRAITSFFRSDYISLQILKSVISTTIAFAILVGLYVMYDAELFMKDIYKMDLFQFVRTLVIIYLIVVCIFALITYVVSLYRYNRALQSTRLYYGNLKKISHLYGKEPSQE